MLKLGRQLLTGLRACEAIHTDKLFKTKPYLINIYSVWIASQARNREQ